MSKQRPFSASSRTAWDMDVDGIDNPVGPTNLDPTGANDQDNFDGQLQKSRNQVGERQQSGNGVLSTVGRGIRSLWATRFTEETKNNRELHIKTTLRELIVYAIFLIVLCIVTFGMTSSTMFYYTNIMNQLFLSTAPEGQDTTFQTMSSMQDFWDYAEGPLLDGLYWETWYNGKNMTDDELRYIFYENKLQGLPRIRMLKVQSNSCVIHEDFREIIKTCYDCYAQSIEDREPFGLKNGSAWTYTDEETLKGSSHWGKVATYGGGGFVQDLPLTKSEAVDIVASLKDNLWLDRGTRVVFVDFTVYNANINLFCVVRLVAEFPATGGVIPSWTFRTVKLIRYVSAMDYFVLACECIFVLYIIYYMVEESLEIKKHKLAYFRSFWNILDIIIILISICCIAFNIYRTLAVNSMLELLLQNPFVYTDFEFLSYWQVVFNSALAIMVFFAWIKVFKYISFNKTMTQLSSTLSHCAKDLAGFAVMFFIVFLAFAQLGYLIFGTQIRDFMSFENSIFTLFRIILGDFNFQDLEQANRILGPAYFVLYVFFVFFVLLNMFLAIINDTYSEVKADLAHQKNEFEMADYFKNGYHSMLAKLNIKRDRIVEIQQALKSADTNNDKKLDFEELRADLKMRGYAEAEIEAVFAKYDLDGDRVLVDSELRKMQADLDGQKMALNQEYDDLEKSGHKGSLRDDSDDDSTTKSSVGAGVAGVTFEEFTVLQRRVDRMEHSIGSIVSKIDAVLVKLEMMERAKTKRRENMSKLLDSITEADGLTEEAKRERMERLVRDELERWDSESTISGRGLSPSASSAGRGSSNSRRPASGNDYFSSSNA